MYFSIVQERFDTKLSALRSAPSPTRMPCPPCQTMRWPTGSTSTAKNSRKWPGLHLSAWRRSGFDTIQVFRSEIPICGHTIFFLSMHWIVPCFSQTCCPRFCVSNHGPQVDLTQVSPKHWAKFGELVFQVSPPLVPTRNQIQLSFRLPSTQDIFRVLLKSIFGIFEVYDKGDIGKTPFPHPKH